MTSNALSTKILNLAGKYHIDPTLSLDCIPTAQKLIEYTSSRDVVIWPADQGGLAWEASGRTSSRRAGRNGRVLCVSWTIFPVTPDLWKEMDVAAAASGRRIIPVRLNPQIMIKPGNPGFIQKLLKRLFPAEDTPVSDVDEFNWDSQPVHIPVSLSLSDQSFEGSQPAAAVRESVRTDISEKLPEAFIHWIKESQCRIHIGTDVDLRERVFAVFAASCAGLQPVITIASGESAAAAVLMKSYLNENLQDEKINAVIRVRGDWTAVSVFKSVMNIPILVPVSDSDIQGALKWAAGTSGLVLILDPGKASLPNKVLHKKSWDSKPFLLLKENTNGSAGRILLIVPGILAKEAGKAADRLTKDNFSVVVLSLRFVHPLDPSVIVRFSEDFDLTIIADPDEGMGGFKADLGMHLIIHNKTHVAIPELTMNGKDLSDFASRIHREDRFRRTVDDVKKDRWR